MDINTEKQRIQWFVDKGNYHAAINISISAMNECRRVKEQVGTDEFISVIRNIVNTMDNEFGSKD